MTRAAERAPIVEVRGLSKLYKVYARTRHLFAEMLTGRRFHQELWALDDVSFSLRAGEIAGVIGRNGAGKSTLLRILAGTLDWTRGEVDTRGSVSSILELGTGFHPEYTGRENVYLGGMCLGLKREEIDAKLQSIADFSELGDVLDRPFKTYSTGMQARLTFATAVSVEPDIFLIDEALAVGDVLFQEKCFRRIRQIADRGTTVLFVTHAYPMIYDLCSRAFVFHRGRLLVDGTPREAGYAYEKLLGEERSERETVLSTGAQVIPEAMDGARVLEVSVINRRGDVVHTLFHQEAYRVRVRCACAEALPAASIGIAIQRPTGHVAYSTATAYLDAPISARAGDQIVVEFSLSCLLGGGHYLLAAGISRLKGDASYEVLHTYREAFEFDVKTNERFGGDVDLQCKVVTLEHAAPSV